MGKLLDLCAHYGITIAFVAKGAHEDPPAEKGGRPWRHLAFEVTVTRPVVPPGTVLPVPKSYGAPIAYRMGLQDPPRGYDPKWPNYDPKHRAYSKYLKERVPVVDDVVASLLCDASCYESASSFKDFCGSFDYSTDSIKARDTYFACRETAKRIRAFLGAEYDAFAAAASEH
jgi:hypothetical protein